jgi:hypothetical protein
MSKRMFVPGHQPGLFNFVACCFPSVGPESKWD